MVRTGQVLTSNVRLLKAKASRYALVGVAIAIGAIILATVAVAYVQFGRIGLSEFMAAQRGNFALWILDAMPFAFAFWGQYVSSLMAYEASAMVVDQTEELRTQTSVLEQHAMRVATHDALTDLPNRVLLRDRLDQGIHAAMKHRYRLALLVMDLDRFKEINDTLGHYQGDRLLKQVATRLSRAVDDAATVSRLGGDEFAILLPRVGEMKEVVQTVTRIQKALDTPFVMEGGLKLGVQVSVGVAFFPEHGADGDTLMQRADVAMYVAKKDRSEFVVYSSKHDQHSPHRLTLMGELRQAIEHDQLTLHFQPKVQVSSGVISGVEALVRWEHPRHGLMFPDDFIPLAERTGLIRPLTLWVLKNALRQCAAWRAEGITLGVAVNLSPQGLLDAELPDTVAGLLAAADVPAQHLTLEITESTLMVDKDRALEILGRLSDMGVRLSIDDFGTGYSSLAYLSKMPVQEIKIDKSFVLDMVNNQSNSVIVHATIELGHNLGLEVTGEGVEDEHSLKQLESLGCDLVQGFFVLEPAQAAKLNEWLRASLGRGDLTLEKGALRLARR